MPKIDPVLESYSFFVSNESRDKYPVDGMQTVKYNSFMLSNLIEPKPSPVNKGKENNFFAKEKKRKLIFRNSPIYY